MNFKKHFKFFLYFLFNRPVFQKLLKQVYLFSLLGRGFLMGANPAISGEINAVDYSIGKLPDRPLVFFDVGANVGTYTQILSAKGIRTIYSFEPSKPTFEKLKSNLVGKNGIFLYNIGFGDKNEVLDFFSHSEAPGLASFLNRKDVYMDLKETASLRTIDSFCSENNIPRIHFLKLDIEGYEFNALKGAQEMVKSKSIDFIQFENGSNVDARTFFRDFYYLLSPHYTIYRIFRKSLYRIDSYNED